MAGASRHITFELAPVFFGDAARAHLVPVEPYVRAGAEFLVAPPPFEHRAASDHDGRQIGAGGAHELRGGGLIAAAQQHDAVERIGADRLLDVHRHQVAEHHRRRPHERLAERDGGELERESARRPDAALDGLGYLAQVRVAVGQLTPGVTNADDGLVLKNSVGETLGLHPRAVDEAEFVFAAEPVL